jgi:hypothetical protein
VTVRVRAVGVNAAMAFVVSVIATLGGFAARHDQRPPSGHPVTLPAAARPGTRRDAPAGQVSASAPTAGPVLAGQVYGGNALMWRSGAGGGAPVPASPPPRSAQASSPASFRHLAVPAVQVTLPAARSRTSIALGGPHG